MVLSLLRRKKKVVKGFFCLLHPYLQNLSEDIVSILFTYVASHTIYGKYFFKYLDKNYLMHIMYLPVVEGKVATCLHHLTPA